MTEKIFETELGNIHYWVNQIDLDKPTLIFLPGLSADHRLFDKQIEFFESKFKISSLGKRYAIFGNYDSGVNNLNF